MPTTTIHFPAEVLQQIDSVARRLGVSRNRFVIQACASAVARDAGQWPQGFFDRHLPARDQALLEEATAEMEAAVFRARTRRGVPLL